MFKNQNTPETPTGKLGRSVVGNFNRKCKSNFKSPLRNPQPSQSSMTDKEVESEIEKLEKRENELDEEINVLENMGIKESELKQYIEKLHEYNEMKDIGQMLLGRVALQRGITVRELYEEYGLSLDD